jgi:hypothetical protein
MQEKVPPPQAIKQSKLSLVKSRKVSPFIPPKTPNEENYNQAQTSWKKTWKLIYISYLPMAFLVELFIVTMAYSWPASDIVGITRTPGIISGFWFMMFFQVSFPLASILLAEVMSIFAKKKYDINWAMYLKKVKFIPVLFTLFLLGESFAIILTFAFQIIDLFIIVANLFFYLNFFFCGFITAIYWVLFILSRMNPYERTQTAKS